MSINIGKTEVINIYIGDTPATAVYIGNTQIWGAGGKDYEKEYFTLRAKEAGNVSWKNAIEGVTEYSLNGGAWTAMNSATTIAVVDGDEVRIKRTSNAAIRDGVISTGNFELEGNINSLLVGDDFITTIPNLKSYQFGDAWKGVSKLVNIENLILPYTTLSTRCYCEMFHSTSITKAPVLPAPVIVANAYRDMFTLCANLSYIKCLATSTSGQYPTLNWIYGVSPTGTFVKDANATFWTNDESGIPSGWTVESA